MRILSLSTVFPNPSEPGLGLFVRARLQQMAAGAELRVVAPVPVIDYGAGWRWIGSRKLPDKRFEGDLLVYHPPWLYAPGGPFFNALLMSVQLAGPVSRIRSEFPFELIDAHFGYPEGVAAAILARRLGVPYAITLRGNETMHAGYRGRRWLMKGALRHAGVVISVSESLRQFAITMGAEPARCVTISNGIDTRIFYPRPREECRRRLGVAEGEKVVICVGSLIERKGHHHVIRALARLRNEGCRTTLWIVGGPGREGHFEEDIHRCIRELDMGDHVRMLGQVDSQVLPELLSAADLLCLASSREGWPNVVHEALGCGTPIVATTVGGIADLVPAERYGLLVPPGDQERLRSALSQALNREWDREGIAALGGCRSWKQVASEVLAALGKLATYDRPRPPGLPGAGRSTPSSHLR
jgi:teichuronic acid biosynthesis glycosyltransferase TuaC